MLRVLIQNEVECMTCGDRIYSAHRHDMKYCKCGSIAVDGGMEYRRRAGKLTEYIDYSKEMDANVLMQCTKAVDDSKDSGRNSLGTVLAVIRVLEAEQHLVKSKFVVRNH